VLSGYRDQITLEFNAIGVRTKTPSVSFYSAPKYTRSLVRKAQIIHRKCALASAIFSRNDLSIAATGTIAPCPVASVVIAYLANTEDDGAHEPSPKPGSRQFSADKLSIWEIDVEAPV
jgi:hypothetical protein